MKLRIALKVHKRHGQDGYHYRDSTLGRALRRHGKTKTWKRTEAWWFGLMDLIGPLGRAELAFNQAVRDFAATHYPKMRD